jgi:hypothetical protein
MADSLWTMEEAKSLLEGLFGGHREVAMTPFEYGWVATPVLSDEERSQGRGLGMGRYVIDRDARVITTQQSLGSRMIARRYAEARRQGRITGRQIWPKQD